MRAELGDQLGVAEDAGQLAHRYLPLLGLETEVLEGGRQLLLAHYSLVNINGCHLLLLLANDFPDLGFVVVSDLAHRDSKMLLLLARRV